MLEVEKNLEVLKKELALKSDFNFYDAFRSVDTRNTGHTTGGELDFFTGLRAGTMNLLTLKFGVNGIIRFSDFI